jgi:cysteine synthase A
METVKNNYDMIGNTPMLEAYRTKNIYGAKANLYTKVESLNPAGSIKDRPALYMIEVAENNGQIGKDSVIIEPTSGNTGIGLAAVCAAKGYKSIFVMPDTMSIERRKLLHAYGAEIVLTPGHLGMKGAIEKADELHREMPGSFIPGQFDNPANSEAHFRTTGPEIWRQMDGKIDALYASIGTGGTITGIARYLKKQKSDIEIVGIEPASSPFLTKGISGQHRIQGIGAGFKPKILDMSVIDRVVDIKDEDAFEYARKFAVTEGILIGISAGSSVCAAVMDAVKDLNNGKNFVIILPDSGERYLSSELYS